MTEGSSGMVLTRRSQASHLCKVISDYLHILTLYIQQNNVPFTISHITVPSSAKLILFLEAIVIMDSHNASTPFIFSSL